MERVARSDTADNRARLFELLLRGTLFAAAPEGPQEEQTRIAGDGEQSTLLMLGTGVLPVFTDIDRMLEWKPEGCGYVGMSGRSLFETAAMNDIAEVVVNPASPTHGSIERWEIETLARGHLPIDRHEVIPEGAKLKIGTAAKKPPDAVMDAVRESLAAEERAVAAWLFLVQEEPNPPQHVIAVAFAAEIGPSALDGLMHAIVQRAGDRATEVRELMFVPVGEPYERLIAEGIGELIFER